MRIVVADDLPASSLELLRAESGWVVDARSGRTPDALAADIADADALLVRSATKVDARLMDASPGLRIIARAGTGVDNVDVAAASARGILVVNAPGANSISVAEHACALMLALARSVPAADHAMKSAKWEKKRFLGSELRGKTLGIAGLGRIGQEVAQRARAFGMRVVAHDPYISGELAAGLGVELMSLDDVCANADYLTLHLPSTAETKHLFDDRRFARCKRGIRLINTARGELIDEAALRRAIESGSVGAAALDVFETEPPADWSLAQLPQVIATPHIAASTVEAQELVGEEIVASVRAYLAEGVIRNAVNFPSIPPEEYPRLRPQLQLAQKLGALIAQLMPAAPESIGIRYYGPLTTQYESVIGSAVLAGALSPFLASVTPVNARSLASQRGLEVIESRSTRSRDYVNVISVKLRAGGQERWVEGTVFEPASPRLVTLDGVDIEAPLSGTGVLISNQDRPGVIGDIGTTLGRHGINIASFALGRSDAGAVGVITVDEHGALAAAVEEMRKLPAIREAKVVRL